MAHHTDQHDLVKYSDSDLQVAEPWQEVVGSDVYDIDNDQIGSVEDLYVDRQTQEPRFLDVGAGGFLGIGEKHFLIPVEAVGNIAPDRVTLDHDQDKVKDAPAHDREDYKRGDFAPDRDYQQEVYVYYGYLMP